MIQRVKVRPVPPMHVDATPAATDATQQQTTSSSSNGTLNNSTIVDPALDPGNIVHGSFNGGGTPTMTPNGSSITSGNTNSNGTQSNNSSSSQYNNWVSNNSQYAGIPIGGINSFDTLSKTKVTQEEPVVEWSDSTVGGKIFALKSSRMEYNRDLLHGDTYQKAAQRFFKKIEADLRYALKHSYSKEFSIRLNEFKDYPSREFVITRTEVRHNYENIDTWHWWFLNELEILVQRMKV